MYINKLASKSFLVSIKKQSKSLAIRQKGESQNGGNKKTKHAKFSEKWTFLIPWYANAHVHITDKKCSFFGKFGALCFLTTINVQFRLV